MPIVFRRPARTALLAAALGCSAVYPAAAVSLMNGASLTVNGLTMTVASCSVTLAGVTGKACSAANAELVASGSRGGFKIDGAGGSALFSNVAANSGISELFVTFTVSANASAQGVTSGTMTLSGNSTYYDTTKVSAVVTPTAYGTQWSPYYMTLAQPSMTLVPPSTIQTMTLATDLKVDPTGAGGALTLRSFVYNLTPAIEASSLSVLLSGIGGLGLLRGRARRRSGALG